MVRAGKVLVNMRFETTTWKLGVTEERGNKVTAEHTNKVKE